MPEECKCGCGKTYWRGSFHCERCGALVDRALVIGRVGFLCGCIKKELLALRKQVKEKK
jgi:hypothetical protein